MDNKEIVSCLTVTKNRVDFLDRAISQYISQDWNFKELVIVYYNSDKDTALYLNSLNIEYIEKNNIRIFCYIDTSEVTLGEVRNYALDKIDDSSWICIWDDDDEYAINRISYCLNFCYKNNLDALTLRRLYIKKHSELRISPKRFIGWEGSLIARKRSIGRYELLHSGEDTPMLVKMYERKERIFSHDKPDLYIYNIHENNTNKNIETLFLHSEKL